MMQWKRIQQGTMRFQVPPLASLSGLKIWHCCELWCSSQMWLGSCVAVAVASSYSSSSTISLGTSICCKCGLKKQKKKKKKSIQIVLLNSCNFYLLLYTH